MSESSKIATPSVSVGGTLFIVAAPSGAGKTSLVKALIKSQANVVVSVSYTTRQPRPGEMDGVDYHFITEEVFHRMVAAGDFLEYAQVFDHYYGTSQSAVVAQQQTGMDVILEIDWQGAQQIRKALPGVVSIFILPPSRAVLEQRLRGRKQDSDAVIARRLQDAVNEISHYGEFDFIVVNDDFDAALADLTAIIRSRHLTQPAQSRRFSTLISQLLA